VPSSSPSSRTLLLALAEPASATPYVAPRGKVLVGVTGGRTAGGYVRAAGKRPAMFQFFVAWGDRFDYAQRRARQARAGLMVHLSTYNGPGTKERITPRDIALGRGDRYLYALGRGLARYRHPVYLRLFSEMNNAANPYSAFDANDRARGPAHSQYWFRQAWRRVYLTVKGGRVATINRTLRRLGQPLRHLPLRSNIRTAAIIARADRPFRPRHRQVRSARFLPRPKVAVQWVPMTAGSPDIPRNRPARYLPGGAYLDWVGTDFYSRFPNFAGLSRFYHTGRYAGRPFAFGEWGMWGRDDPAFMRRFFDWVAAHPRVRMLAYYQGNRTTSPFRLYRYPRAARVMREELRSARYSGARCGAISRTRRSPPPPAPSTE
jgi:hypothetical protein